MSIPTYTPEEWQRLEGCLEGLDMTDDTKTIVEVNGVKLEVDLRYARRIEEMRVGDRCRVLIKPTYGGPGVHTGVVVGFEPFATLPTIVIAYIKREYSSAAVKFLAFNKETTDAEIVRADDKFDAEQEITLAREALDREVEKAQGNLKKAIDERDYFNTQIKPSWQAVTA